MIASIPPIFVDNYVKDIILIKKGGYLKWLSPTNPRHNIMTQKELI
jgi:hypothetical protein